MKRKRRAAAPLRRGPAVLLGDGCLLLLVLAGTVFSFLTAFSVQIHALPLLLGCAAAALAFLGLWSLPRRWWALPLALLAAAWVLAVRRLWQPLALGADALRVDVANTVSASLELGFTLEPALSLPEALWTNCARPGRPKGQWRTAPRRERREPRPGPGRSQRWNRWSPPPWR